MFPLTGPATLGILTLWLPVGNSNTLPELYSLAHCTLAFISARFRLYDGGPFVGLSLPNLSKALPPFGERMAILSQRSVSFAALTDYYSYSLFFFADQQGFDETGAGIQHILHFCGITLLLGYYSSSDLETHIKQLQLLLCPVRQKFVRRTQRQSNARFSPRVEQRMQDERVVQLAERLRR